MPYPRAPQPTGDPLLRLWYLTHSMIGGGVRGCRFITPGPVKALVGVALSGPTEPVAMLHARGRVCRSVHLSSSRGATLLLSITLAIIIHGMIRSFADLATEDLFNGVSSRRARRACPAESWPAVRRKLTQLNRVQGLSELRIPPGNRLKRLRGDRAGQYSIRVNDQYRICFRWEDGYADDVEVTDYH
jgi:proteic killer suppression protein